MYTGKLLNLQIKNGVLNFIITSKIEDIYSSSMSNITSGQFKAYTSNIPSMIYIAAGLKNVGKSPLTISFPNKHSFLDLYGYNDNIYTWIIDPCEKYTDQQISRLSKESLIKKGEIRRWDIKEQHPKFFNKPDFYQKGNKKIVTRYKSVATTFNELSANERFELFWGLSDYKQYPNTMSVFEYMLIKEYDLEWMEDDTTHQISWSHFNKNDIQLELNKILNV